MRPAAVHGALRHQGRGRSPQWRVRFAILAAPLLAILLAAPPHARAAGPVPAAAAGARQSRAVPVSPGPPPASAHTPAAGKEQRFDQAQISLWLRRAARVMHVSTGLLWTIVWLINLLILIWVLYFLLYRMKGWSLPGQMKSRARTIRRRLAEADEAILQASARLRAIETRLAGVPNEIIALREQTVHEAELEYRRLSAESAAEAEKIARAAARQIETAGKTAQQELRHYAGELAVAIAERRLRHRVDASVDRELIHQAAGHFAGLRRGENPV